MRTPGDTERGFTLLELAIVLAILAVLAAATVPYAATQVRNQAAEKTAREMLAIGDAARAFFVANQAWPASVAGLQTAGFLPSGWSPTNPFGPAYTLSSGTTLTVTTTVPADVAPVVARLVPLGTQTLGASGTQVAGTWPRPGQSSDLAAAAYPAGGVTFFDGTTCPTGMLELTSARGRTLVGLAPGGTLDGTVGGVLADLEDRTHTHPYSEVIAHAHSLSDPWHTHGVSDPGHFHPVSDPGHPHGVSDPGHAHEQTVTPDGAPFTGTYMPALTAASAPTDGGPTSVITTGITISSNTTGISIVPSTTGISIGPSPTGISVNSTGIPTGTTGATSATMPYLQLLVCRKS